MGSRRGLLWFVSQEGYATLSWVSVVLLAVNALMFTLFYGVASYIVLFLSFAIISFFLNFFKNPHRHFDSDDREKVVVSPADGEIVAIEEVDEFDYFGDRRIQVSIFMSVFSMHSNWYPVDGTVVKVGHQNGRFRAAFKAKSSTENERSLVVIRTNDGQDVLVRQIAGALARRIVTYPKEGDHSRIDKQLGFIKLGSRVDLYLPVDSLVCVKMHQKVKGNLTIIAKLP